MVKLSHVWYAPGVPEVPREMNMAQLHPWTYHQVVVLGKVVAKTSVDSMPPDAEADRQAFVQFGAQSTLAIPLSIGSRVHHLIAVHSLKQSFVWPQPFIQYLRLLGEVFVGALARRDMLMDLETYRVRLEVAAASAEAGLWELDLRNGEVWLTDKVRELLGFSTEEVVTVAGYLEKIHPEDRAKVAKSLKRAQNPDEALQVEYRVSAPDGALRWMMTRGRVQWDIDGEAKCMTGVVLEITRHKQMEAKLQHQVQEIKQLRDLLEQENTLLRSDGGINEARHRALGISVAMQAVKAQVEQVAGIGSTVLIQGETGTGKELIAQAVHQFSNRSKRLMVTVNCAALPSALIESELFGREKGAYTGALSRQAGRFEVAHGSTLFLDEIAEMPLDTQAKLLRVLQDGSFERLGSSKSIKVDVRIIAATNRNLVEEVEQGRFRRDLFYRLNVFPIHVPPLRDRMDDIPLLAWKFIGEFGQTMGRKINRISSEDMERLTSYAWPGNVRELRNVIERAMITSTGNVLDLSGLDLGVSRMKQADRILSLAETERQHIEHTLRQTRGKVKGTGGAAELLDLHPSTLYSRMRKLGVQWQTGKG
jgi:PAS domain S-box-containing protein